MGTQDRFNAVSDEHRKFERISNKRSLRRDLHAFILLDEKFPTYNSAIVGAASHDEIWIDLDSEDIEKLTDENILELVRCGVMYNEEHDSLSMFT